MQLAVCTMAIILTVSLASTPLLAATETYLWSKQFINNQFTSSYSIASSSDGMKLITVGSPHLYTSTDAGINWQEHSMLSSNGWTAATSSDDGVNLAVSEWNGYIYTSNDSGQSWTQQLSSGQRMWYSLAASADGSQLLGATIDSLLYFSADSGSTWASVAPSTEGNPMWLSVAMSSNASRLIAINSNGEVYISLDLGVTWRNHTLDSGSHLASIASSSDGLKLVANSRELYTSTDGGSTWTQRVMPPHTSSFHMVSSSADGSVLAATSTGEQVDNGELFISRDYGQTWVQQTALPDTRWGVVAISDDGTRLATAALTSSGEELWTALLSVPSTTNPITNQGSTLPVPGAPNTGFASSSHTGLGLFLGTIFLFGVSVAAILLIRFRNP